MSKRPGQDGSKEYIEGGFYKFRLWVDLPGEIGRRHPGIEICPVKGSGALNKSQREAHKRALIAEHTGKNTDAVESKGAITFERQARIMMAELRDRLREPVAESTLYSHEQVLRLHLNPLLGGTPLSEIYNPQLKKVVHKLVEKGAAPASIEKYIKLAKQVVASAIDPKTGESTYPRKWRPKLIDQPIVDPEQQDTPTFSRELLTGLAEYRVPRMRMLFTLAGATGARISEMLGLEIDKHISPDFRTITILQQARTGKVLKRVKKRASRRQVDLHTDIAAVLKTFINGRTSGFLFVTKNKTPIGYSSTLPHLHGALKALGYSNDKAKSGLAGAHAFRRARNTFLRNETECPEGLLKFWMGHSPNGDMSDLYDQVKADRKLRLHWAERCGYGFDLPSDVLLYGEQGGDEASACAA
jgi:integrase